MDQGRLGGEVGLNDDEVGGDEGLFDEAAAIAAAHGRTASREAL